MGAMGGAGGIPWTAIDRYADRHEVEDFDGFKAILKALDSVYLEHLGERTKSKGEKKPRARKGK